MNRIRFAVKSALGLAMLAPPFVFAQATGTAGSDVLEEVVVTGIRASVQQSLDAKRAATSVQEVITAEDIGKMPDKNVADSLHRVPGVTTSSASANEGGFDENDRVSMRGTNPSLTQTLINGHGVAAGDWFVLNQVQQVGRSVSYTLLPSELVSQVVVQKSSHASLVEGGVAGSVNIITRKPLDFPSGMTFQGSGGVVFAELPDEVDPQFNALFNYKNDAENFGVLLQGFSETRHLRRDGVEILGYETIRPDSPLAQATPSLANVAYPVMIGAALFEQERERTGGLIDIQLKPSETTTLGLSGFVSNLDASNYNRNYLVWLTHFVNRGMNRGPNADIPAQGPDPGFVVRNGTLVQANFAGVAGTNYAVYDQISRPGEKATSSFITLDGRWDASDKLTFTSQLGTSEGHGETPAQDVAETHPSQGGGAGFQLQGIGAAPNFNVGTADTSSPAPGGQPVLFGWIFGHQNVDVEDNEDWARIDAAFAMDRGAWTNLKFGVRYQTHERSSSDVIGQGPTTAGQAISNYPTSFSNYPGDFNTFGGSFPTDIWYWTPEQLAAYNSSGNVNRDPVVRLDPAGLFSVDEKNTAGYVQLDFKGSKWAADIGLRAVRTEEDVVTFAFVDPSTPGATTGSAFGTFIGIPISHTYNDILPSANLKIDLNEDLVARFAASRTMTRADYSALAGFTSLSPPANVGGTGTGSGGNPDLEPIRSTNLDAGLEWYFAPRSLLSAGLFFMDLDNYVGFGSETKEYLTFNSTFPQGAMVPYLLTVPVNATGEVKGFELAYQQAFNRYLGVAASYTYADGEQTSLVTTGDDRLVGTSEDTYSVSAYFENQRFSARVAYTYRSEFFSGLDRNTAFSQDEIDDLAASLVWTVNDSLSFSLDGHNLNNPTLKYYALHEDQPRAFYKNGAQYYFTARVKF
jgi:iron complex outermembrane recepter protein